MYGETRTGPSHGTAVLQDRVGAMQPSASQSRSPTQSPHGNSAGRERYWTQPPPSGDPCPVANSSPRKTFPLEGLELNRFLSRLRIDLRTTMLSSLLLLLLSIGVPTLWLIIVVPRFHRVRQHVRPPLRKCALSKCPARSFTRPLPIMEVLRLNTHIETTDHSTLKSVELFKTRRRHGLACPMSLHAHTKRDFGKTLRCETLSNIDCARAGMTSFTMCGHHTPKLSSPMVPLLTKKSQHGLFQD